MRKTVLAGVLAFVGPPAAAVWLNHNWFQVGALVMLAAMIAFAHRSNLLDDVSARVSPRARLD